MEYVEFVGIHTQLEQFWTYDFENIDEKNPIYKVPWKKYNQSLGK